MRACCTPKDVIDNYQRSLRFWCDTLKISDSVKIVDYEDWVYSILGDKEMPGREELFSRKYDYLSDHFDKYFFAQDVCSSLIDISKDPLGYQLSYTFWSIIASVNYESLYGELSYFDVCRSSFVQNFYISYIASLKYGVDRIYKSHLFSKEVIGRRFDGFHELVIRMRNEAWIAAKRYVAISLTDRELNLIGREDRSFVKLTIHGKRAEYHFISTSQADISKTAQHTTGGIIVRNNETSVTYKYRLERDFNKQKRVYLRDGEGREYRKNTFDPVREIARSGQPIFYLEDEGVNHV